MDFVTFFPGFSGAKVRVGYTSVVVNENYNKYIHSPATLLGTPVQLLVNT